MRALAILVAALVPLGCNGSHRGSPVRHDDALTFPVSAGKVVAVDVGSLDVEVEVAERADISAEVELEARSSDSRAARRWVERHIPVFEDGAGRLEIRLPNRRSTGVMFGYLFTHGSLRLTLPPAVTLELRTSSGDVRLEGRDSLAGAVRLHTGSGDVRVDGGADAEMIIQTSSGDVRVSLDSLELIDVETTSGDVALDTLARRVSVETTSGDVRADGLNGDLQARTRSGDVQASWGGHSLNAQVDVTTSSGEVVLRLPSGAVPAGRVETRTGEIRSVFEGRLERRGRDLTLESADATARLNVRTSSGDVELDRGRLEAGPGQ